MKPIGIFANSSKPSAPEVLGRFAETAKRLGIGRQTLYNKIKSYGIDA